MKRSKNNFRYYPIYQKRIAYENTEGNSFDDYKTIGVVPSDWKNISSQEASFMENRHIQANIRVNIRHPQFEVSAGDRLVFFRNLNAINPDDIIRVSSYEDKTNRKEYLNLLCLQGAYAGKAPVQNSPLNFLVKAVYEEDEEFENAIAGVEPTGLNIEKLGLLGNRQDFFYKNDPVYFVAGANEFERGSGVYIVVKGLALSGVKNLITQADEVFVDYLLNFNQTTREKLVNGGYNVFKLNSEIDIDTPLVLKMEFTDV